MKIIKEGKLPCEKEYTTSCSYCKTVFEFKANEAKFHSDQREGDWYQVTCPLKGCGKIITVRA